VRLHPDWIDACEYADIIIDASVKNAMASFFMFSSCVLAVSQAILPTLCPCAPKFWWWVSLSSEFKLQLALSVE
jgi:hypothetical protein